MRKISTLFVCCLLASSLFAQTDIIKVMHYNLLQYGVSGCGTVSNKNTWLSLITGAYQPDIFTVNEMYKSASYMTIIKNSALTYNAAMDKTTFGNSTNSDLVNCLFYNTAKLGYLSHTTITGSIRDVDVYKLYHKAGTTPGDTAMLWCLVTHLKAGSTTADEGQRAATALSIMNWLAARPYIKNAIVMGDMNVYDNGEQAYVNYTSSSNPNRLIDALGTGSWAGGSNAIKHTQSPKTSTSDCGTVGGMDDRFDFILASQALVNNTDKIKFLTNTYKAYGNEGNSYNVALNCTNPQTVSATVCGALQQMSDHLPVVVQLEVSLPVGISEATRPQGISWSVLGNPVADELKLAISNEAGSSQNLSLEIMDLSGKIIWQENLMLENSTVVHNIPLSAWTKGLYFVKLSDEKGRSLREKVVLE